MALPININDLLNRQRIESNRIEFKKGWNPASIYHSVCAFANDLDDLGGGYIIVGVETDNVSGMAIRPVEGLPLERIDGILQEMVGFNNKLSPYYMPRTSVEVVDGKHVLVIWCPAGNNRPYSIPENVTSKGSKEYFYVRSGTSSIIAQGEVLDELREMANRIPFDERGNQDIKLYDVSMVLLRDYLVKVGSKLAENGSPRAVFETTDDRLTFLVTIPVHDGCQDDNMLNAQNGSETNEKSSESKVKSSESKQKSSERIIELMRNNPTITTVEIAMSLDVSSRSVEKQIRKLREKGRLKRDGSDFRGQWIVID